MVYASGDLHIDAYPSFGGYMAVHFIFDIHAEVNDAMTNMHCQLTNNKCYWDHGSGAGGGFINVSALLWNPQPFDYQQETTLPESWNDVYNNQLVPGSNHQVPNNVLYGVYEIDTADHHISGELPTRHDSWDFPLGPDNFDENGDIKNIRIAGLAGRAFHNRHDNPDLDLKYEYSAHWSYDPNRDGFQLSLDSFRYNPWAVRHGAWQSCDRTGGGTWKHAGDWQKKMNNSMGSSTIWVRKSGKWVRCPKIGS